MKGELFINGKDAYLEWGIGLENGALLMLMTPPPNKDLIENKSRLEHGKRMVISNVKVDERTITLEIHMVAKNKTDLFSKYNGFCEELAKGVLEIGTIYQPDIIYRMQYLSCEKLSGIVDGIIKLGLRLCEYNPSNRSINNFQ